MAKFGIIRPGGKREKTIVKIKLVVEMLHKTVLLSGSKTKSQHNHRPQAAASCRTNSFDEEEEEEEGKRFVKEGHFTVFAVTEEGEVKRFVVPLSYLEYPPFTRLLKQAEEEYGFGGDGTLTVPCHPTELENLLSSHQHRRRASGSFMLNKMTNWRRNDRGQEFWGQEYITNQCATLDYTLTNESHSINLPSNVPY